MADYKWINKDGKRIRVPIEETNVEKSDKAFKEANAFQLQDKNTPVSSSDFEPITPEEKAQALRDTELKEQQNKEFELYGDIFSQSPEDEAKDLFQQGKNKETELERQIRILNEADAAEFEQSRAKGEAAKSAVISQFSSSPEGIETPTTGLIRGDFSSQVNEQMRIARNRLSVSTERRSSLMKELRRANAEGSKENALAIRKQIAAAQNEIDQTQLDLANAQAQNTKQAFDFLQAMPAGTFADMDLETMTGFGLDIGTASMIKSLDQQRQKAQLSDPDYIKKMNEAMTAGMTQDQKDYLFYTDLLKSDPVTAQAYAVEKGFSGSPSAQQAFDNQMKWNDYALKYYNENGVWPSKNGQVTSDGAVEESSPVGAKGGKCGEYVNNYLGTKLFGDSLVNKKQKINSDTPVAGGAFISKYGYNLATIGQTGHVGLVTKVYEDGSFDIKDSNRNGDEMVDTAHITDPMASGIVGFFDPGKQAPGWNPSGKELVASTYTPPIIPTGQGLGKQLTERDAVMAQIKAGEITPTEVSKYRRIARNQGWLDEFTKALTDPKAKPLSVTDSTKYGVPSGITQYQLDEILAYRESKDLGNKTFQAFINDTTSDQGGTTEHDKLVKFVQLRDNLEEAKQAYENLQEEGGGISGWWDESKRLAGRIGESVLGTEQTDEQKYFRQLQALTGEALVQFVKEISGVAVSEPEFQRLRKYKPNVGMTEGQFMDQLDRMIEEYGRSAEAKAKRFGFSSVEQMNDVIAGKLQANPLPTQNNQENDPLNVIEPQDDPLNLLQP